MIPQSQPTVARALLSLGDALHDLFRAFILQTMPDDRDQRPTDSPQSVTAKDLSGAGDTAPTPVHVVPLVEPLNLSDQEAEILEALVKEGGRLQGPEIGRTVKRKNDASLRRLLSRMRHKRKLLDWAAEEGYGLTRVGLVSFEAWRDNQLTDVKGFSHP